MSISPGIYLARFMLRLGTMIRNSAILTMQPEDLIHFSRRTYRHPQNIAGWSTDEIINEGLYPFEKDMVKRMPVQKGDLLILGMGAGREAIAFAKQGFTVTGVDFVEEYLEISKKNAAKAGVTIKGIAGDISKVDLPKEHYNVIWFSISMYSAIPTRKRRIKMLKNIHDALTENGLLVCQFRINSAAHHTKKITWIKRIIGFFLLGNYSFESGDTLWMGIEFFHVFKGKIM